MEKNRISRREFALATSAVLAGSGLLRAQAGKLTAGDVVDRIHKNLGIPWDEKTYRDTFKTGGPSTPVKGIASTFMSTLAVFQRSVKAGANLIITHEPTFWSDPDRIEPVKDDALYKFKLDYANNNNIATFRLHDHWHARHPDGISTGWNKRMGWVPYQVNGSLREWKIPETTLGALAKYVAQKLETNSVRVVGDPSIKVSRVNRGGHTLAQNMEALPNADCVIVSEAREVDSHEFFRDAVFSGEKRGAIIISHEAGEEAGMDEFAAWIKPIVPEVPTLFVPTHDDLWTV